MECGEGAGGNKRGVRESCERGDGCITGAGAVQCQGRNTRNEWKVVLLCGRDIGVGSGGGPILKTKSGFE